MQRAVTIHRVPRAATSMECIKEHLPLARGAAPCAVLVEEQTGGRGSGGRPWASPKGNLHLTVALPLPPAKVLYAVPLLVALSLHDAVRAGLRGLLPAAVVDASLRLKWPNDLLWDDKKLAGAIVECAESGELLVGVGVNCVAAPEITDGGRPAVALADIVAPACGETARSDAMECLAPDALAALLCRLLVERVDAVASGALPREEIMAKYAAKMNMSVVMFERRPDGSRGDAVTPLRLTDDGHLVVSQTDGTTKVLCAEYLY